MDEVTVTFTVSSNNALLLITCYGLLTGKDPADSIDGPEHLKRLLDAIGCHQEEDKSDVDMEQVYSEMEERDTFLKPLNLSVRTHNTLKRAGVKSREDLQNVLSGKGKYLYVRMIGPKSRREIAAALAAHLAHP